jgi:ATP-dependent DNA helicase DinG
MNRDIEQTFSADGILSQYFSHFQPRQGQLEMADCCFNTLRDGGVLLAEAGTGIGKTFAYGAAALLSGRKVIISTATKNLQDQLAKRDLPTLCQALDMPARILVMKGRENYVCQQRVAQAAQQLALTHQRGLQAAVQEVKTWATTSQRGELAEILGNRSHVLWDKVCARSEFCALVSCDAEQCAYPMLRKDAEDADILIVNHHLLGADLAMRAAGLPALLPERDAIIIDEAHQLPAILTQALGQSASTASWGYGLRELSNLAQEHLRDMPQFSSLLQTAQAALGEWQATAEAVRVRLSAVDWSSDEKHQATLMAFMEAWRQFIPMLGAASERHPSIKAQAAVLGRMSEAMIAWQVAKEHKVAWVEAQNGHWYFYVTPMSIADAFSEAMKRYYGSCILASATLSTGGAFDYIQHQLGLWQATTKRWLSPFDYAQKAMLYLPTHLPEPNHDSYTLALLRRVWPLILACGGRAFLLFTSYRAMSLAADTLRPHLPFPLLVQGEQDAHSLVDQFRQQGNAVLLATAGFWEGVDVSGPALSLVMIDKIPFSPPDDPVSQAKQKALEEKGLSSFVCEQLPEAAIALVQGAGRLIRSETDEGVLIIGDQRLQTRRYGSQLLSALPPMRRSHHVQEVKMFIEGMQKK